MPRRSQPRADVSFFDLWGSSRPTSVADRDQEINKNDPKVPKYVNHY
jgi:hypothetical protein